MSDSLILYIKLFVPRINPSVSLAGKSWLLSAASKLKDGDVYAFADPSMKKSSSLGRVFSDVFPDEGTWENCVKLALIHYPEFQTSAQTSA